VCKEKSMELQFSWVWTEFPEQNSQLQGTSISFATLNFWKILEIMVFNSQVMSVLRLSDMCHECLRIAHKKLRQRGENLSLRQQPRSDPWQPHCSMCSCVFLPSKKQLKMCVSLLHLVTCRLPFMPFLCMASASPPAFDPLTLCTACDMFYHHLPSMSILCLCACVPMCSVVPESLSNLSRTFQAEGFDHTWFRLRSASVVVGLHPDEALTPTMIDSTSCNWLLKPIELECDWGIHTILKHYQHFRTFYTMFEHFATVYTILQPHLSGIIIAGRI